VDRLERTLLISDWLRSPLPADEGQMIREAIARSCSIFGARRALLVWEEREEPWQHVDYWNEGTESSERSAVRYDPIVHPRVEGLHFHTPDAINHEQVVAFSSDCQPALLPGPVVHADLARRFDMHPILSLALEGDSLDGRLFLLNPARIDRFLAEIVASAISSRFDQFFAVQRARTAAVGERMLQVARDLHDGLLQSFTGIVLQLETVHDLIERDRNEARRVITQIQAMLMADQRELRTYLEKLRPGPRIRREERFDFRERVDELARRMRQQWGLDVTLEIEPMERVLSESLGWETYRIVAEAVTNSAKHGEANRAIVRIGSDGDSLRIVVVDNGHGLLTKGRYNLIELSARQQGPAVLGERVASLNGDAILDSTDSGLRLEITLPLGWKGYA
jgi:signal transduction histidine kinase